MATIHKKVWREYFEKIISGKKKLELRLADFEVNEGDTLVLEEWDKDKKEYTGRKVEVIANYILKTKGQTFWSPEEVEKHGFQIIQFEIKSRPGYYLGTIIDCLITTSVYTAVLFWLFAVQVLIKVRPLFS